jgi:hypothetical protein
MRSSFALACSFLLALSACSTREPTSSNQARVRNQPPAACTPDDFAACPAIDPAPCPDGQEPVIDYSSDCCPHFSCQPQCTAEVPCPMGPAPTCPPGSELVITTATDCCPAYRCAPKADCTSTDPGACPLAMPWCGDGIEPQIVGYTDGCCPIYQCPCDLAADGTRSDPTLCGCTFPSCPEGQQLQCRGDNICGYPCECVPADANCQSDADCGPDRRCDLSYCLPSPGCDPADPSTGCDASCYGICVGQVQNGCRADSECPSGQHCELQCMGWGCVPSTGDDGPTEPCTCPEGDWTCTCSPDGSCGGQQCDGWCVPDQNYFCDEPPPPDACPPIDCVDPGATPVVVGTDPATCCPLVECQQSCIPKGIPCAMADCADAVQVGTDENCCPVFCCPGVDGSCPTPAPVPEPRPL